MRIVVNGTAREAPPAQPLADLLTELGLGLGWVVVEYNGTALSRSEAAGVGLAEGDRLEIVRAVAGG